MRPLLLLALLGTFLSEAHATSYTFSYTRSSDGKVLAGQLDGTLQADNNTVVVNALIGAPTLAGMTGPLLSSIFSTDRSNFGTVGLLPKVSLNGSFMDFIACDFGSACNGRGNAFTFNAGNLTAATYGNAGAPFDAYDGFFGAFGETYVPARWSLTPSAVVPVPEPGSAALLLVGGAALVWTGRRRTGATPIRETAPAVTPPGTSPPASC